jgi:hypothetical protein
MRQGILAAALLAASAGLASADYVVIVANVGASKEITTVGGPGMGMPGMMRPGMPMPGGPPGGMTTMPPSMPGGPPGGMTTMPPGGGSQGGPPPGVGSGIMTGGMRAGMGSGMMMGMMGVAPTDVDDIGDYVIAVVEVKPSNSKAMTRGLEQQGIASVGLPARLGKSCQLLNKPPFGELFVITEKVDGKDKPIPTVSSRFKEKMEAALKEKASVSDLLTLAEWALEHGLIDHFPEVMNKVVEADKGHSAAVAYVKIKADLDRKAGDDSTAAVLRNQLLHGYKVTETPHYLLMHNLSDTAVEIKSHSEHLENAFRGFYYWFALRGIALPVPPNRQVVVLTSKTDDFELLRKILTAGPVVVDGFFARREDLVVMHSQRQDDPYKALSTFWENWKSKGYQRYEILQSTNNQGRPKNGVPQNVKEQLALGDVTALVSIAEAQMLALMLKALEQEAELATVSHNASRQLLFASGLLPRNVAVPEWILFGMGSFFETPLQSPWPTIGTPSPYYLPRWRELKGKSPNEGGLEKTAVNTLRKVVTDGYFRTLPSPSHTARGNEEANSEERHIAYEAALRKARTASWALTYFLAQKHLDGLRHYFAELSKMPRDIELDDTVLLSCFARAFGCVDSNNKVDEAKLKTLANDWYSYWQTVHFESEPIMKEIRDKIAKKVKEAEEKAQKQNGENNGQQGPGMFFGPFPPGQNPPQSSPAPGMNPQQRGPQQGGPPPGTPLPPNMNPQGPGPGQRGRVPPTNPGNVPPQNPTQPKR